MAKSVEGLELLHIKTYTYENQKKKLLKQNLWFSLGAIIPIINLIIQAPHLNLDTLFGKIMLLISIGLVFFDFIIYVPIYFINVSLLKMHKRKRSLLFLYTIRRYERLIGGIFYICFIFLIMPTATRNQGIAGWLEFFKDNLLISIFSFISSIACFLTMSNKELNNVKKEVLDSTNVIEVYETNKETKDVTIKVYDNKRGKIATIWYNLKLLVVLSILLVVFVVFVIYMLKIKLQS